MTKNFKSYVITCSNKRYLKEIIGGNKMNVYDIRHEVLKGRMSAQEAYELVKANASRPFFITSGQLEEFRIEAIREAVEEARK